MAYKRSCDTISVQQLECMHNSIKIMVQAITMTKRDPIPTNLQENCHEIIETLQFETDNLAGKKKPAI